MKNMFGNDDLEGSKAPEVRPESVYLDLSRRSDRARISILEAKVDEILKFIGEVLK